ncbi:hypothetical protein FSP39_015126 [Pinctada imbricata]|uniref:Inter-alpha-trypsin inhibitor heavy chain H4 n=1 Tax=Pinctada imbricata TaxID=66713 RepID=A0AA88YKA5_PINIB|nr:hypothetical protein FSP39_015126 [Pinctada imbricata]
MRQTGRHRQTARDNETNWNTQTDSQRQCDKLEHTNRQPETTPKIYSLHIRSDITYRFSNTLVTSKVANPDTVSREAKFDVTLPNEAFITKFKLIINNKTYDGEVKEKEEAKQQYEAAKDRGQSAGQIVAKPRETNMFEIMVNVAAQEKVIFELTYQELLRRKKGRYSHVTYINPGQLVNDFLIEVKINESRALSELEVPAIRNDILTDDDTEDDNELAVIERPSPKSALITYRPTIDQQRQESERGIRGQFVVEYDIERENLAGELLVVNGYFVHYFAPDELPPLPMDIVFILDKSGSMNGRKIVQLKEAMNRIFSDMRTDDRFTIMTFDGSTRFWRNTLVSVTDQTLLEAKDFVDKIPAMGSTNINAALVRGISSRAPVIIFLTDGEPTTGITNPTQILSNVRSQNEGEVPIFSLAFGRGADYKFTKKLAAQNNGLGRKIYEDSDSSLQILGFIEEISTVLLKNVTFKYLNDKVNQTTLTKTNYNTVFGGSEVIISGRLADKTTQGLSTNDLPLKITGTGKDEPFICVYPLPPIKIDRDINVTKDVSIGGYFSKITEKLWAYLTVKQMLRKLDALTDKDEKQKVNDRILQLSIKVNIYCKENA